MSESMERIVAAWSKQEHERLGQYFINRYTKSVVWPELFHATNVKARLIIEEWLEKNQYQDVMPRKLQDYDT